MEEVGSTLDFLALEHRILAFWKEQQCFEQLREKNRDGPVFRFLDGPITANNPMGVHHAWGRTIKDLFIRFKAMNGYSCNYQNGFDSQGLWVEVEVERELGFKSKQDIVEFGLENFTRKCVERVQKYSQVQTAQSIRLGQWMDWGNSYFTHWDSNITGIWHFLKRCHERGWIVQSHHPLPWCPRCGTSLSEHEMTGSYRDVEHLAVFVKLPLIPTGRRMLVWTTTPWTLAANVALAVNPALDYCEVLVEGESEPLILAQDALGILEGKAAIVRRVFPGKELVGRHYETCFPELPAQTGIEHQVVPWELVDPVEGTGVVHIAPGCGLEDFQLGQQLGLPTIMPVDESGVYTDGFGWLTGRSTHDVAALVEESLRTSGRLFKSHMHTHSYPVCWRCKSEVIFRLTKEWFINTAQIRPALLTAARQVLWEPEYVGKLMEDWLANMGDWNISRRRFYGLPLPFYPCEGCGELTVVGSREELRELGGSEVDRLPELHRPWIDEVKITCPKCGSSVSRIPEVGDVWLDAGIVPYTTLGFFTNREQWIKYYPAEWITEMREQVRLWFYSMLFMGVTLHNRAPYERVLAYETVVAEDGTRFSKTGYMIEFNEAAERMGADPMRYLFAGASVANDVRFGYGLGDEARRHLLSLWNIHWFFTMYAGLDSPDLTFRPKAENLTLTDRWLLARTNLFLRAVTPFLIEYQTPPVIKEFESYINDVSNWYVRANRRRFWKSGDAQDKQSAYWCLHQALRITTQVMAPIVPFMTEEIWQSMIRRFGHDVPISVHLSQWPQPVPEWDNDLLLEQTERVRRVIYLSHRLRNQEQLRLRQPLACMYTVGDPELRGAIQAMEATVADEANVKRISCLEDPSALEVPSLALNLKKAGPVLKEDLRSVSDLLSRLDEGQMADAVAQFDSKASVDVPGWAEPLPAELFRKDTRIADGIRVATEGDLTVALDVRLSKELVLEGLARDLVRRIQILRRDGGLKVEQQVLLGLSTDSPLLKEAIAVHGEYIAQETLAQSIVSEVSSPVASVPAEISGQQVQLTLAVL